MINSAAQSLCRLARGIGLATTWNTVPALGAVLATGPEVTSFLQAQLTSDVSSLHPGGVQISARLDRRGALRNWFHILRMPERGQPFASYLLVLPADEIPTLLSDLEAYVFDEGILLENVSNEFDGLVLQGPAASDLLSTLENGSSLGQSLNWSVSWTGDPGHLLLWPRSGDVSSVIQNSLNLAREMGWAVPETNKSGDDAWSWLLAEAGWPIVGKDLNPGERVLPQTGLENLAVSFSKGCYLGQEVVARIRTYGSVPQAMRGIVFSDLGLDDLNSLPHPRTDLVDPSGKKMGTWGRAFWSEARQSSVALAFLGREFRTPNQELQLELGNGLVARGYVQMLPLHHGQDAKERAEQLHHRAVTLFSQGENEQPVALLEEALSLDPSLAEAYEALGVILGRNERFHEAIDIFKRLEEVAPDEPMVHTNLSLYYMKVGDKEEAERQKALGTLKRFGNTDPSSLQSLEDAEKQARQEDARRKQSMFAEVLEFDPEDPLALMGMGNALIDLDELPEAEHYLARALNQQQDNSALYLSRGKVLQQLNRAREAMDVFTQGVEVASRRGDLMPLREMEHRLALLRGAQ